MAQGSNKSLKAGGQGKAKSAGSARKNSGKTRPGRREVAPKAKQLLAERQHKKQLSTRINANIEKQMVQAAQAGKLSIMRNVGEVDAGAGKDGKGKGKAKA